MRNSLAAPAPVGACNHAKALRQPGRCIQHGAHRRCHKDQAQAHLHVPTAAVGGGSRPLRRRRPRRACTGAPQRSGEPGRDGAQLPPPQPLSLAGNSPSRVVTGGDLAFPDQPWALAGGQRLGRACMMEFLGCHGERARAQICADQALGPARPPACSHARTRTHTHARTHLSRHRVMGNIWPPRPARQQASATWWRVTSSTCDTPRRSQPKTMVQRSYGAQLLLAKQPMLV